MLFDFHNDCIDIDGNIIFKKVYSMEELEEYKNSVVGPRMDFENEISEKVLKNPEKTLALPGFSETAGAFTNFLVDLNYSNNKTPNFRERLVCPLTQLNNRQRFICSYMKKVVGQHDYSSIFAFEQATPVFRFLSHSLNTTNVIGSEYLGINQRQGKVINGIRHEDAIDLSFNDESFDVVFSCEVLNRTPDIYKALSETYRVTRNGGMFVFSTPFGANTPKSMQRAMLTPEGVQHLAEPRYYHGPHARDQASPVFYDLGWDLFDLIRESGFKKAYLLCYYSALYGYLGEGLQSIFVAEK
jgi:SAM-dependent methyltransferase